MSKFPLPDDLPSIQVGGRERRLMLTLKDLRLFREQWGGKEDSLEAVTDLLHKALVHDDPELTPEDVEEMVHLGNLRDVTRALVRAQGRDPDSHPLLKAEAAEASTG